MNHTAPKTTAPVDHSAFGQTMLLLKHNLQMNLHPYSLIFCLLLLTAIIAIACSFNFKDSPAMRVGCYIVAFVFVSMCIIAL